ncbi:MAG TPA: helix-turn-helix transcriptional regulator, partial [Solirubrobacterales bacterium]|nr:helix-turn-helix transcriptional regulator [Solirubrobacterales bacterium]
MSLKVRFSANLRRVRARAGITQTELGLMTELHRTEISLLENAKRMPRLDTLVKLTSALECRADELIEGMVWKPNFQT